MAATNEDSNKDEISQKALDDMEPLDFSKVPKGPQILAALAGTLWFNSILYLYSKGVRAFFGGIYLQLLLVVLLWEISWVFPLHVNHNCKIWMEQQIQKACGTLLCQMAKCLGLVP